MNWLAALTTLFTGTPAQAQPAPAAAQPQPEVAADEFNPLDDFLNPEFNLPTFIDDGDQWS